MQRMAAMARDMGLPFAPPTEGFQMPEPPGSTGYDFISGHAACSAADVEALPRTDEWWLVATKEMDDAGPLSGMLEEEEEEEEDEDYLMGVVRFLNRQVDGKTVSIKLGMHAASVASDYRGRCSVSGTAELLYRSILTACMRPLVLPIFGPGSVATGSDSGFDHEGFNQMMRQKGQPRRPAVVFFTSEALARPCLPALARLGIEARVASRPLARACSQAGPWEEDEVFKMPLDGGRVGDADEDEGSEEDDEGSEEDEEGEEEGEEGEEGEEEEGEEEDDEE